MSTCSESLRLIDKLCHGRAHTSTHPVSTQWIFFPLANHQPIVGVDETVVIGGESEKKEQKRKKEQKGGREMSGKTELLVR